MNSSEKDNSQYLLLFSLQPIEHMWSAQICKRDHIDHVYFLVNCIVATSTIMLVQLFKIPDSMSFTN